MINTKALLGTITGLALAAPISAGITTAATAGGWQTCTWNGAPLACVVDHTANGQGWTINFENGARNIYWIPSQTVRVTNQQGMDRNENVRVFLNHDRSGLTAIDSQGGVLKAPFRM